MKGAINYVGGETVSYLVLMRYRYTTNIVDCPFDIFIETSKLTVRPPT
jgi:hypothetical protein